MLVRKKMGCQIKPGNDDMTDWLRYRGSIV
jgi:hypothetical protein